VRKIGVLAVLAALAGSLVLAGPATATPRQARSLSLPGDVPGHLLGTWWSGARGDNYSSGTDAGDNSAKAAGYVLIRDEGAVESVQGPGTVPLQLWWSGARGDNFTTATAAGQNAARAAGYVFIRNEGYVWPTQVPGTVPLELWWSGARGDNFTTATDAGKQSAKAAGYVFIRVEGYVVQL
jgi:hypothetical protein